MAYIKPSLFMPLSVNGQPKTLPDRYGVIDVSIDVFNQDVDYKRLKYKTDSQDRSFPLTAHHYTQSKGKYLNERAFGMFYYRMISSKPSYNFGIITGDKSEIFQVFNGYPEKVTLTSVTLNNLDGVTVVANDGSFPVVVPPYRSVDLRLILSSTGSAQINGSFTLNFSNGDTLTLNVSGSRLVLWVFQPDWSNPVSEQFEYKTDIITSYNKKEQRRGFMVQPRQRIAFDGFVGFENAMLMRNVLHGWQDKAFMMPLWWQVARLAENVLSGATEITIKNNNSYNFVDGGSIVLWRSETDNEVLEIKSISGNVIKLTAPVSGEFYVGTVVYPSVQVRVNQELRITANNAQVASYSVDFDVVHQHLRFKMPINDDFPQHNGIEVLEKKSNWAEDVSETHKAHANEIAYSTGVSLWFNRSSPNLIQREATFVAKTYQEILWWKAFIQRRRGALKSFLLPTQTFDNVIMNDIQPNQREISLKDLMLSSVVKNSSERKYIRVKTTKNVYYFTVSAVNADTSGRVVLTTENAYQDLISVKDVVSVSFMLRARFASDTVEIKYLNRNVAEITAVFQQIREI